MENRQLAYDMSSSNCTTRASSAPSRRGDSITIANTALNQTRPLSSTTIDSKNFNNEHNNNSRGHLNNDIESASNKDYENIHDVCSNYDITSSYDIVDNSNEIRHQRPRSGRTGFKLCILLFLCC